MKAQTAVCPTTGATVASGRVIRQHRRDVENEEIQMYLSKLKDLVPFMPKNRKLTKLEVIQNVIDYICDLQTALESHPAMNTANGFDAAAALRNSTQLSNSSSNLTSSNHQQYHHHHSTTTNIQYRQPLGVLPTPNTILPVSPSSENHLISSNNTSVTTVPLIPIPEKLSPTDGRPISC